MTDLPNFSIEAWELVSHSKMFKLNLISSDSRALRVSRDIERDVAMIVLEASLEIWVTNSRPRPRFAPVMTQTGMLALMSDELKYVQSGI